MEKTKKEKNHVILITVLVILLLVVFFAFGYFLGGTNIINDVRENNTMKTGEVVTPEEKESAKDFDNGEAKKLLEEFGFYENIGCGSNIYSDSYSDNFKMTVAMHKINKEKSKDAKCSDYYSEADLTDIYGITTYKGKAGICTDKTKVVSYSDLNEVYKKMYGKDAPKDNINGRGQGFISLMYDYNKEKDVYVALSCGGCGGSCGPSFNINEIKSAKEIGDYLYVDVKYYYYIQITNDYNKFKTNKISTSLDVNSMEEAKSKIMSEYMDYLDTYEVVFKKVNNDYQFVSVSQILS